MIIEFNPTQSNKTRYPATCPVWIFDLSSSDPLYDDISTAAAGNNSFRRGIVQSACMDFATRELYYRVLVLDGRSDNGDGGSSSNKVIVTVTEDKLGYGAGCPVSYQCMEGTVLLCRRKEDGTNVYTIELDGRFEDNVPCDGVSFRIAADNANGCNNDPGECDTQKDTVAESHNALKSNREECTLESNQDKQQQLSIKECDDSEHSTNLKRQHQFPRKHCERQQQQAAVSNPVQTHQLTITIPMWVQMYKSKPIQRSLFFHLLGPNGSYIKQYQQRSNCRIVINWDDHYQSSNTTANIKPITITIDPHDRRTSVAQYDMTLARRLIEDNLLRFSPSTYYNLAVINNDGSMGRLLYEIAVNCSGSHRPESSTSNAVWQTNPFDEECKMCFMSLLDIPVSDNAVFRLDENVMARVTGQTGCSFSLVGNEYGIQTLYCEPYILVLGHEWRCVDGAVEILKEEIARFAREDAAAAAAPVESVEVRDPEIKTSDLSCSIASVECEEVEEQKKRDESKPADEYQGQNIDGNGEDLFSDGEIIEEKNCAVSDLNAHTSNAHLPAAGAENRDTTNGQGVVRGNPFVTPQYNANVPMGNLQMVEIRRETVSAQMNKSSEGDVIAFSSEQMRPEPKWTPPKQSKVVEHPQLAEKSDCFNETKSNKRDISPLYNEYDHSPSSSSDIKRARMGEHNERAFSTSRSAINGYHLYIPIPLWIQNHRPLQRNLYQFIIGTKSGNVKKIQRETNCLMEVVWDEYAENHSLPRRHPMTILLKPVDPWSKSSQRDLQQARMMVENTILLKYHPSDEASLRNVSIADDGSRGRLVYDIAAATLGPHRPKGSKSHAVQQKNPFDGMPCFMTVLDLPRTVNKFNTIFHGHFLTEQQVITKVKTLTGCSFKMVGNDFGIVTRFCEPFVLVFGNADRWDRVDQAVEILKYEIERHQSKCACFI